MLNWQGKISKAEIIRGVVSDMLQLPGKSLEGLDRQEVILLAEKELDLYRFGKKEGEVEGKVTRQLVSSVLYELRRKRLTATEKSSPHFPSGENKDNFLRKFLSELGSRTNYSHEELVEAANERLQETYPGIRVMLSGSDLGRAIKWFERQKLERNKNQRGHTSEPEHFTFADIELAKDVFQHCGQNLSKVRSLITLIEMIES